MIYVVIELIPTAQEGDHQSTDLATVRAILGFTAMMMLDVALAKEKLTNTWAFLSNIFFFLSILYFSMAKNRIKTQNSLFFWLILPQLLLSPFMARGRIVMYLKKQVLLTKFLVIKETVVDILQPQKKR